MEPERMMEQEEIEWKKLEAQLEKDLKTVALIKAIMSSQFPETHDFSGILESIEGNV